MKCVCTGPVFPPVQSIPPGLSGLPRALAGFPELRAALLSGLGAPGHAVPFSHWRAREGTDLGLMLVDMWAYLADILAFYDQVHANEAYLRTATQRESVRKLTALLAYRPTPAVAATVELVLRASGKSLVTIPAGTAFRSGAVAGGPPQVFELDAPASLHPLRNEWRVAAPRAGTLGEAGLTGGGSAALLLDPVRSARFQVGDVLVASAGAAWVAALVWAVAETTDTYGQKYRQVTVDRALDALGSGTALGSVQLWRTSQTASVHPTGTGSIPLSGVIRAIRPGHAVVVQEGEAFQVREVESSDELTADVQVVVSPDPVTAKIPYTSLTTTQAVSFLDRSKVTVHYGLVTAGVPVAAPADVLASGDALALVGPIRAPRDDPGSTRFAIEDDDDRAAMFTGEIDYADAALTAVTWTPEPPDELRLPVTVSGNVAVASRGESVIGEVLGSGDASRSHQTFTLKKSPLTFVTEATSATGIASTLTVYVDGVAWEEVETLYGAGPTDRVFVVRLDEAGAATLTFGDGVRGSRLPTGSGNVVADYRFGAGAAVPEARSISQVVKPVSGLASVRQPLAAVGGADAQPAEGIRQFAPQQALFLGRAVSIADYQAVVSAYPGVRVAKVGWAWSATALSAQVVAWFVGSVDQEGLRARLRGVSDPTVRFVVSPAEAVAVSLALEVDIDAAYVAADVEAAVSDALWDTAVGVLPPERAGIGAPFRFSALRARVHQVPGVIAVRSTFTFADAGEIATASAVAPGQGRYFDFEGSFSINGTTYGPL